MIPPKGPQEGEATHAGASKIVSPAIPVAGWEWDWSHFLTMSNDLQLTIDISSIKISWISINIVFKVSLLNGPKGRMFNLLEG